jgi:hypothetical protein
LNGTVCAPRIEASHFVEGGVYLTVSRHQVADYKPYVFKSEDFGKTWTSLRCDLPDYGFLHTVRESPANRNLLFVGSEFGLFVSADGGKKWIPLRGDFPTVAVRDIQIHPREHDLIIGTHGRGVWVADDIRPLEGLTAEAVKSDAVLFGVKDAALFSYRTTVDNYSDTGYAGTNSPFGAAVIHQSVRRGRAARSASPSRIKDGRESPILSPRGKRGSTAFIGTCAGARRPPPRSRAGCAAAAAADAGWPVWPLTLCPANTRPSSRSTARRRRRRSGSSRTPIRDSRQRTGWPARDTPATRRT